MAEPFTKETIDTLDKMGAQVAFSSQSPDKDGSGGCLMVVVIDRATNLDFHTERLPYGTAEEVGAGIAVQNSRDKPKPKTKAQAYTSDLEAKLAAKDARIAELEAMAIAAETTTKKSKKNDSAEATTK